LNDGGKTTSVEEHDSTIGEEHGQAWRSTDDNRDGGATQADGEVEDNGGAWTSVE
jgi:hypothetical protein